MHLQGQGDVVSILITSTRHTVTPVMTMVTLLPKSPSLTVGSVDLGGGPK